MSASESAASLSDADPTGLVVEASGPPMRSREVLNDGRPGDLAEDGAWNANAGASGQPPIFDPSRASTWPEKAGRLDAKRPRDPADVLNSDVPLPALDRAEVCSVNAHPVGERLLGEPLLRAEPLQVGGQHRPSIQGLPGWRPQLAGAGQPASHRPKKSL